MISLEKVENFIEPLPVLWYAGDGMVKNIKTASITQKEESISIHNKDREIRRIIAEGLVALGNMTFGGLLIGQAFIDRFNPDTALVGIAITCILYLVAFLILKGRR